MSSELELPPLAAISVAVPLGPETERAWQEAFELLYSAITKHNARLNSSQIHSRVTPVSTEVVQRAFARLQSAEKGEPLLAGLSYCWWQREMLSPLLTFWQRKELSLEQLIRFLALLDQLESTSKRGRNVWSYSQWPELLLPAFRRTHPEIGLREFAAALSATGLDSRQMGLDLINTHRNLHKTFAFPPERIWPYWLENADVLEHALVPTNTAHLDVTKQRDIRRNALEALSTFPVPPATLVPLVWPLALGSKTERPLAQRCLAALPDKVERLIQSLSEGNTEARVAAAEWLGRLNDQRAVAPLIAALKKEKSDLIKGALMSALETLGAPLESFLDRAALLKEAQKGLVKGLPTDLQWFPMDGLPEVHWHNDGTRVDPVILHWWLVQTCKLKNPEPGPLLRKYAAGMNASQRENLGQFILEAWIAQDTQARPDGEAETVARQRAQHAVLATQSWNQFVKNNPQLAQEMAAHAPPDRTLEDHFALILPLVQHEAIGSAISSKGILAIAGACVGADAVPVVERYLKEWYGLRAAQCRALLQMLAWVEHKTATQLLLAVGNRFRTKSIQEEANKQAQALAERKGWSVAELADRTIPTAGLDASGTICLDFGARQFTAQLNEDLELSLTDVAGKPIKALPEARAEDDATKAAAAKKTLASAKKELKTVISAQRDRLHEAMCTQRQWSFEDWDTYLNRHPIMRHHCQRVVWLAHRAGKTLTLFRPLPDGSLTDAADDPVTLQPDDFVSLAHEIQVTPEQSLAWRQHLRDYNIEPLIEQFGRPQYTLPEELKAETELVEFRGHLIETFKLRNRATKLGYVRGQTQDGGWFYDYQKRFPTLGVTVIISFTGNALPELNRVVALQALSFESGSTGSETDSGSSSLSLQEVPPVLLHEGWNDFRQLAAEGTGFDPGWEQKTQA